MVMPMGTVKIVCLDCSGIKVINQPSDVVILPRTCQKCGGVRLTTELMTITETLRYFLCRL